MTMPAPAAPPPVSLVELAACGDCSAPLLQSRDAVLKPNGQVSLGKLCELCPPLAASQATNLLVVEGAAKRSELVAVAEARRTAPSPTIVIAETEIDPLELRATALRLIESICRSEGRTALEPLTVDVCIATARDLIRKTR